MNYTSHTLSAETEWLNRVLALAREFDSFALLDSCNVEDVKGKYNWLAGGGSMSEWTLSAHCLSTLKSQRFQNKGWWFGRINYDLKNELEDLQSDNPRRFDSPEVVFFEAEWVVTSSNGIVQLHLHPQSNLSLSEWISLSEIQAGEEVSAPVKLEYGTSKSEYISSAKSLLDHVQRGDIYEVNYCIEFFAEKAVLAPLSTYRKLRERMAPPMSAMLRFKSEWILSMSPERYLQKTGNRLLSQPIKGTAKRSEDKDEDQAIARQLFENKKERAENVMIVDLVRNDLSRVAKRNSVEVTELFGVYTFPTVHQMISTVEADLSDSFDLWDAIQATFPMGSMTGAPKHRAMQLIEQFENHKRGVYSGAIGYITPEDDFDFNVVIRTVIYDENTQNCSVSVGSALTIQANPEHEWEECQLKLKAIREVLELSNGFSS